MTSPTGPLRWGQAGNFDAIEDRTVIAALCNLAAGLVKPATLAAGTGLNVVIGAWQAVVSCGDGTYAVVGSRAQSTIAIAAGPGVGTRTDVLWVDLNPDAATWTITARQQSDTVGRLGISLGTVTVPTNGNLATGFTLVPAVASYMPWPMLAPPVFTNLTGFSAGAGASASAPPQWSKDIQTGLVRLRGQVTASTSFAPSGVTIMAALPAAIVPPITRIFVPGVNFVSTNHPARVNIGNDGTMQLWVSTSDTINFFSLDGINYFV